MHVLVFPGWYPSNTDQLSGDFIQRHMVALAQYCKVSVVIPVKDPSISKKKTITVERQNLTEIYYYYPSLSKLKLLDNVLSFIRHNYLSIKTAAALNKVESISVVQLCVLQKNLLLGLLLKIIYKTPYVISEHSTFYIDGGFDQINRLQKTVLRFIFKQSAASHAVSKYLASTLQNKLRLQQKPVVISNVVDTTLFYYRERLANETIAFIHVSNMSRQKNVEGMLAAFAEVQKVNKNFVLNLVGPLPQTTLSLISHVNLGNHVVCWNERSYQEVAEIMQQSDVFVFFTRYETFGCVIIEANACGLPVIVSDLEVTRELVFDKLNGLFVENENVTDLANKIVWMIKNGHQFNSTAISGETTKNFNYQQVGEQLYNWLRSTQ